MTPAAGSPALEPMRVRGRVSPRLFGAFIRMAFYRVAVYRLEFFLRTFNNLVYMYAIFWLWTTLYITRQQAFDVSMDQMVTYAMLSHVLGAVVWPGNRVGYTIARELKNGSIQNDLIKPLDFHFLMLALNVGEVGFQAVILGLPMAVVGAAAMGLRAPASLVNGALFLVSGLLGYLIIFSLSFLLGMLAIFTLDIRNISWAYNALVRLFSGQEIPLWLFPAFFQRLADALPFKYIYAVPLSIYIGRLNPSGALHGMLLQAVWALGLLALGRMVWRRAYTRLIVQGG